MTPMMRVFFIIARLTETNLLNISCVSFFGIGIKRKIRRKIDSPSLKKKNKQ